jgi:RND family efflux transporter MFP subunit
MIALALLTGLLSGCGDSATDPRTLPPLVRVMSVTAAGDSSREFTGIVAARVQSDLGFRVGGKVVARYVNPGQTVRRGQPLMRIDGADLALATQAASGVVAAAQARARQTAADEVRMRGLVEAGAISASAYDQAKAAAAEARAQLAAASAQAGVARNATSYSVLVADADGTVVETLAEPGQVVAAGQVVVRLARSGPREALINLPETLRPALGSTAQARTYNGAAGTGQLRQLSDAADPLTRTFEARYVLVGPPSQAPLGSTVTIAIATPGQESALAVPLGAIRDTGSGPGVWILTGGKTPKANWRPVKIASVNEEFAIISAGVRSGETIVALGAHLLHQGQPVRIAAK